MIVRRCAWHPSRRIGRIVNWLVDRLPGVCVSHTICDDCLEREYGWTD